jgi:hypothetical protein
MKKYIVLIFMLCMSFQTVQAATFETLVFDDLPNQIADPHSFFDGEYIWYPYMDNGEAAATRNKILRFTPKTNAIKIIQLASTPDLCTVYQTIQGQDPDTVWVYSSYGQRALWKFSKSSETSTYHPLTGITGDFGGKIASAMVDGIETIVSTSIFNGYPTTYRVSDGRITSLDNAYGFTLANYGLQVDKYGNFFITDGDDIKAFSLDADHVPINIVSREIENISDLAWDGLHVWGSSFDTTGAAWVKKILPTYSGETVDGFEVVLTHDTGSLDTGAGASIKANNQYVVAVWESGQNDPPTIGWTIYDKERNEWSDFWNTVTNTTTPEGLYPYTDQYWNTVCVEIDVPGAFYITGYDPELSYVPNTSMHILKMRYKGSILSNGTLSNATLSGN